MINLLKQPCALLMALLIAPAPAALAQTVVDEGITTERIVVSGRGSVDIAPDMAVLSLTVTREAKTARAALDANSSAMADVIKAMRARGIAEGDLQTANFSIQPKYSQVPRTSTGERPAPVIVGYTVRNSLSVRVRDITKLGDVIDESVTLGVNQGGSILFANDDPSEALTAARIEAVKDARQKAATLAAAAEVKAGRVLQISERSYHSEPMPMMRATAMADAPSAVPIAAGENNYSVTVQLMVAIEQ